MSNALSQQSFGHTGPELRDSMMDEDQREGAPTSNAVDAIAERVLKLAEELEASGDVQAGGSAIEHARAALHRWVDEATGFVTMPAFGRVTVIHDNGRQSSIQSPDLSYRMSIPLQRTPSADR
jgi:hypothetical protein